MSSEPHAEHSEFLIESSLQRRCYAEGAHTGANLSQGLFSRSAEHNQFLIESSWLQRCRAEARRWMRISVRVRYCHCSWNEILFSNTTIPSLLFCTPTVSPLPSLRELFRIPYSQSISSFIIQAKKFLRQQNWASLMTSRGFEIGDFSRSQNSKFTRIIKLKLTHLVSVCIFLPLQQFQLAPLALAQTFLFRYKR